MVNTTNFNLKRRGYVLSHIALCIFLASIMYPQLIRSQDFSNLKKKELFDIGGNIGFNSSFSDYGREAYSQSPWASSVSAGLNLTAVGFNIPLSFIYSNGKAGFTHPFVRLGISPSYKGSTLHLGHRSMNLSSSIFSGKTFFGAGTELNFPWLQCSMFFGRLEEAQPFSEEERVHGARFSQYGFGGKIGIKRKTFHISATVFKASDKPNSIPIVQELNITPQDNFVAGMNAGLILFSRLSFNSEFAVSAYTKDIGGKEVKMEKAQVFNNLIHMRSNSSLGYVATNSIAFTHSIFSLRFSNRIVSQDYYSLGIQGMARNQMTNSALGTINLFENALMLSGSYSTRRNNLTKKQLTTSLSDTYNFNCTSTFSEHMQLSLNYTGVHTYQKDGKEKLDDSKRTDIFTQSLSLSPSYNWEAGKQSSYISLNFDYSGNNNLNKKNNYIENSNSFSAGSSYNTNLEHLNLNTGANYLFSKSKTGSMGYNTHSLGVTASKAFLKNKNLNLNSSGNISHSNVFGDASQTNFVLALNLSYRIKQQHNISFSLSNSMDVSKSSENLNKNSIFRASLSYNYSLASVMNKAKKQQKL